MEIYRDCNCTSCADFDNVASFGIYQCSSFSECQAQSQSSPFMRVDVPITSITQITAHSSSNCTSAGACYEKAAYRFVRDLPPSNLSYHVVFQRCCYASGFTNIQNSDQFGITVHTEIAPNIQQMASKTSPRFTETLVLALCTGQPFEADFSCSNPDNYSLIYEFGSPLNGGGNLLSMPQYASCEGAYPTPGCPPPFSTIPFIGPSFQYNQPFVTNSSLALNPSSGLMTGLPNVSGRFLASIYVHEAHQGTIIGRHQFHFLVTSSPPTGLYNFAEKTSLFSIFPNPAGSAFLVRPGNSALPYRLSVFNLDGKRVYQTTGREDACLVDGLPPGLFILQMEQGGQYAYAKVMVTGN